MTNKQLLRPIFCPDSSVTQKPVIMSAITQPYQHIAYVYRKLIVEYY